MRLQPGGNGFQMSRPCFHRAPYDVKTSHATRKLRLFYWLTVYQRYFTQIRVRLTYSLKGEADGVAITEAPGNLRKTDKG